jgi:hypothetical protein
MRSHVRSTLLPRRRTIAEVCTSCVCRSCPRALGVSITPTFFAMRRAWLERGGVLAYAHVRGGGEKGEALHLAGQMLNKQRTIDDFVACASYLVEKPIALPHTWPPEARAPAARPSAVSSGNTRSWCVPHSIALAIVARYDLKSRKAATPISRVWFGESRSRVPRALRHQPVSS